eukprot:Hpha_TRINITY_DN35302_c0_g1::TRINITY_DN35302_c0_g1_i1::g.85176::m.85176
MRAVLCLTLVSLVVAGPRAGGGRQKKQPPRQAGKKSYEDILRGIDPKTSLSDLTEEQREAYEAMQPNQKCNVCEQLVERAEKAMKTVGEGQGIRQARPGEGDTKKTQERLKKAAKRARAIEIVESLCDDMQDANRQQRLYCHQSMEQLEDKLTDYIVEGEIKEDIKIDICDDFCEWKVGIKNSIKDMQSNFMEQVKEEELKKRTAQEKERMAEERARIQERLDNPPSLAERVWNVLMQYWWIYAGFFAFMALVLIFLPFFVQWQVRRLQAMKAKELQRRKAAAAAGGSTGESGADASGGAARRRRVAD